jgi:hypothetical protein
MRCFVPNATASLLLAAPLLQGYSVLTHETIVDSAWDSSIQPMLVKRFPAATAAELLQAHAYAYGGCIVQDMGYYPFGNHLFSELTHYVRTGDFIFALVRESKDVNEYAFALGSLAHYAADTSGHRIATNIAVPILYPNLGRRFGKQVTYWDNPTAHVKTEFGFDVLQVAAGHYASDRYREFIGFQVSKEVLERAFLSTYGLELKDVFSNLTLALGSFRYGVSSVIPTMTVVAWKLKGAEVQKSVPGISRDKFLFNLSRSSYEKAWGSDYQREGIGTRLLTLLLRLIPKVGPFKSLAFRLPTPEVEKLFMTSFNTTVSTYRGLLGELGAGRLKLPNENFDVGEVTSAGTYKGADLAYDKLLVRLADHNFDRVSLELKAHLLAYYRQRKAPVRSSSKKAVSEWAKVMRSLELLRSSPVPRSAAGL